MKKIIVFMVVCVAIAVAGFYTGRQYKVDHEPIYEAEPKSKEFSIADIPEDEICYRGTGVWNGISPQVRYPDIYQGLEHIAVYFNYGPYIVNEAMACFEKLGPEKCKENLRKRFINAADTDAEVKNSFEGHKADFEYYPEELRSLELFSIAKSVLEPTLGQCGNKKRAITLHYEPTDDVFQKKGTLGIYIEVEYNHKKQTYFLKIHKYRPDGNGFVNLLNSSWSYSGNIKSTEDLQSKIRSHFYNALIK
jgi:hypothetical protein